MGDRRDVNTINTTGTHAADGATNAGPSMAINSTEQIYSPIQIRKLIPADAPGFEVPRILDGSAHHGPFGGWGGEGKGQHGPTVDELNPYFAKLFGGDGSYWMGNIDFHLVANNGKTDDDDMDLNIDKLNRNSIEAVQINAMRGPLLLSGFGFDCGDLPVPPRGPSGEDMYSFDITAPQDRKTWKSGPIAVKWDEERKVWEGGPQIVCGYAAEPIEAPVSPCDPTEFKTNIFRRCSSIGEYPAKLTDCYMKEQIVVVNRDPSLTQELVEGQVFVVAVRINYEWIPIWVGCPEGEGCIGCGNAVSTGDQSSGPCCQEVCPDACIEPCGDGGDDDPGPGEEGPDTPTFPPGTGGPLPPWLP